MAAIYFLVLYLLSYLAMAEGISLGSISDNITEPIQIVSGFVSVGCLIVGSACLFASIVKYFEHRRSPLAVPISTVIWLVLIGLALLVLPFAYLITGQGIPFDVLWGGS